MSRLVTNKPEQLPFSCFSARLDLFEVKLYEFIRRAETEPKPP